MNYVLDSLRLLRGATLRRRHVGRRTAWSVLIVAALAFKAFIPLLAVVSAQMQGKEVADVCPIYGVRLAAAPSHDHNGHHAMTHAAGVDMAAMHGQAASPEAPPADHTSHTRDHCALTSLAICAVLAAALWTSADWDEREPARAAPGDGSEPSRDASARWLTLRLHAPPPLA